MTTKREELEALHTSIAFARAFIEGDGPGATAVLLGLAAEDLPAFTSGLVTWLRNACELGGVAPGPFLEACAQLVDRRAAQGGDPP